MMQCRLLGIICFLLYTVLCCAALAQEASKGPRIVVKEQVFDFGTVSEGEVIEHVFKVVNDGDRDLKIIRVKPG